MAKKSLKTYLQAVNSDQTIGTIAGLAKAGFPKDEIREALPGLIDDAIRFDLLVPGAAGVVLEAADGPIIAALVDLLWPLLWRRAERKAAATASVAVL
jgi:hypothetical protein